MKTIKLSNAERELQGRKVKCFFTGVEFEIDEHLFEYEGHPVESGYAHRNGFILDNNFKAPATINNRGAASEYVSKVLGIRRGTPEYFPALKLICDGLPMQSYDQSREIEKSINHK